MPRPPIVNERFADDLNSGRVVGRPGGSIPSKLSISTFDPTTDVDLKPGGRWVHLSERQKWKESNEAAQTAATLAADPVTQTLREAALIEAENVKLRVAMGQPGGVSRTDEVLQETDSFRISRSSDGTIRTDLHCRPDLKPLTINKPTTHEGI